MQAMEEMFNYRLVKRINPQDFEFENTRPFAHLCPEQELHLVCKLIE